MGAKEKNGRIDGWDERWKLNKYPNIKYYVGLFMLPHRSLAGNLSSIHRTVCVAMVGLNLEVNDMSSSIFWTDWWASSPGEASLL